jgi:hypothetical protein
MLMAEFLTSRHHNLPVKADQRIGRHGDQRRIGQVTGYHFGIR